jgi:hypothetical protein
MEAAHRLPYVVVRYHYDPVRDEAVNLGVIVQLEVGLRFKLLEDPESLLKAYPFLDKDVVQRKVQSLTSALGQEKFRIFDYAKNEAVELAPNDSRLFSLLKHHINHDTQLTSVRYAELPSLEESQLQTLLGYLYQTLVQPPVPARGRRPEVGEGVVRHAYGTLHKAAQRAILRAARKVTRPEMFELDAAAVGQTRTWQFDLKIRPVSAFVHHVLVLPNIEETYWEAAGLARIWQDVRKRQRRAELAALYYSKDGIQKDMLRDADRLLNSDEIRPLYPDQLEKYYSELLGQKRFW